MISPLPPSSPSSIRSSSACAEVIHGCTEAAQFPTTTLLARELSISTTLRLATESRVPLGSFPHPWQPFL